MENGLPKFDFHLHSNWSDGRHSPRDIVKECKNLGLEVISLTDHENVGGILEAMESGKELGIRVIPGIEFTSSYKKEEHHILGYFIDYQSLKLREFLTQWRKTKIVQIKKIVKNLQKLGFKITFEEVMAQVRGSIDRPHVSWAIFQNLENRAVLEKWQTTDQKDFFRKFLLENGLAYVERERPKIQEVIYLIQSLGGMAFWAHPLWRNKDISKIRERTLNFRKNGLEGIEICYPFNTEEQTQALHQIAQEFSMYESAGSDFHGFGDLVKKIGSFRTFGIEPNLPPEFSKGGIRWSIKKPE